MKAIMFQDRLVVVVKMPDGRAQPFYKSTGRNSGRKGVWFPFDGVVFRAYGKPWFDKHRFCSVVWLNNPYPEPPDHLDRFGSQKYKDMSDKLAAMEIEEGEVVTQPEKVNVFIRKQTELMER